MATTRLFRIEDVEQAPPAGEWELVNGEHVPVASSGFETSSLGHRIGRIVGNFVDAHALGLMTGAGGGYVLFPNRQSSEFLMWHSSNKFDFRHMAIAPAFRAWH